MANSKFTISIGVEKDSSELDAQMDAYLEQAPFDKRKIGATLIVSILLGYGLFVVFWPNSIPQAIALDGNASSNNALAASAVVEKKPQPILLSQAKPMIPAQNTTVIQPQSIAPVTADKVATVVADNAVKLATTSNTLKPTIKPNREKLITKPRVKATMKPAVKPSAVLRAVLTRGIKQREPIDNLPDQVYVDHRQSQQLYFFTELLGLKGHTIIHRWYYNDKQVAQLNLPIGSDRWRTYSSKTMPKQWLGAWRIEVLDQQFNLLKRHEFTLRQNTNNLD